MPNLPKNYILNLRWGIFCIDVFHQIIQHCLLEFLLYALLICNSKYVLRFLLFFVNIMRKHFLTNISAKLQKTECFQLNVQ